MANRIGLITKWSTQMFDEAYVANARSSVLDANKGLLSFVGAKTVRFPKWSGSGLYNYNRANYIVDGHYPASSTSVGATGDKGYGFQQGDSTLEWEERTMRIERGVQYRIDSFDNEETGELAVALSSGQINKQKIIPEVDAYCFSQIVYEACSAELGNLITNYDPTKPLAALNAAITYLDDNEVEESDIIGFVSNTFKNSLRNSTEVTKFLNQGDFNKNIHFNIDQYNDIPLINVTKRRFYTHVVLAPGLYRKATSADVSAGIASAVSQDIDVLLVAKSAVYHVIKYNKIQVFTPEVVQDYRGYKVNALIYHDVFVPDNKKIACYCVLAQGTARDVSTKVVFDTQATKTVGTYRLGGLTTIPGSTIYDGIYYDTVLPVVDTTLALTATAVNLYDNFTVANGVATEYLMLVREGKVIAFQTLTLTAAAA